MKKVLCILGVCLLVIILGYGISRVYYTYAPEDEDDCSEEISYLNDEVDFRLYIYGENIDFPDDFQYEQIDELKFNEAQLDADYVYLIINDLDGNVNLTDNDVQGIVSLTEEKTNFNYFYIGTEKLSLFGKYNEEINYNDQDMSIGSVMIEGDRLIYYGLWRKDYQQYLEENPNLLYEDILESLVRSIKSNEEVDD